MGRDIQQVAENSATGVTGRDSGRNFVLLLGAGNRIFGEFLEGSFGWAVDLLMVFEAVTVDRVLFWGVIAVGGLSALLPIGNFRLAWLERLSWWVEPPKIAAPRYLQTLLAAVVLAAAFRQSEEIIGRRGVRAAAIFWIVQNLFLVLGVSQRLKLYTDA